MALTPEESAKLDELNNALRESTNVNRSVLQAVQDNIGMKEALEANAANIADIQNASENAISAKADAGRAEKAAATAVAHSFNVLEKSIETTYALARTGKVYGVKIPLYTQNTTTVCEKILDNAGLVHELSTETTEGRDDYADIPLFQWMYVNYVRDEDGSPRPVAIEGTETFRTKDCDVGAMQMSFYVGMDRSESGYQTLMISDSPHPELGLVPWCECVTADGRVLPWCIGSAVASSRGTDGNLYSQLGGLVEAWMSYMKCETEYQKKGKGYHGAGIERNTFGMIFDLIKNASKSSQSTALGCTQFDVMAKCTTAVGKTKRIVLATSDAERFAIGDVVVAGTTTAEEETSWANDRNYAYNRNVTGDTGAVIKAIDFIDEGHKALVLDVQNTFDTKAGVGGQTRVYSWYPQAGSTARVYGHHDGHVANNGRWPHRIQGREYLVGGYVVGAGAVIEQAPDYNKPLWIRAKGTAHSNSESVIKSTYKRVATIPGGSAESWHIGDVDFDFATGTWWPLSQGGSSTTGRGDYFYGAQSATSGTREFLQGGHLWSGSDAGLSCLFGWTALSYASWHLAAAD